MTRKKSISPDTNQSRHIYIGDVHGCTEELRLLMDRVRPQPNDTLVFLGDLVDKGPDSPGTVQYVRSLTSYCEVVLVLGNHEAKHSRYRNQTAEGKTPKMKRVDEIQAITSQLSSQDIEFLESAVPYYHHSGVLAVHAGVSPAIKRLPTPEEYLAPPSGRDRDLWRELTMVRHVNSRGRMVPLGKEKPHHQYWANIYDGRFGVVVFGHQPFMDPWVKRFPHALGLDLGCVFGGNLCAGTFENNQFVFWLQPALDRYAQPYQPKED